MARLYLSVLIIDILSCERKDDIEKSACGICDPVNNISWLQELVNPADSDQSGNFIGTIWLEKYKDDDIFVTNMAMGSGGVAYYFFDCDGSSFIPENIDKFVIEMKLNIII
jgi:hypothetical protein